MLCQHCINFPGIAQGKSWANIEQKDKILWNMNYKTTKYLCLKDVLDSNELQMLRRADYMRECNILRESHVWNKVGTGYAESLLSLAFVAQWNPKHPTCISIRLFCNFTSQFCCRKQTIWDVQSYWQAKFINKSIFPELCK